MVTAYWQFSTSTDCLVSFLVQPLSPTSVPPGRDCSSRSQVMTGGGRDPVTRQVRFTGRPASSTRLGASSISTRWGGSETNTMHFSAAAAPRRVGSPLRQPRLPLKCGTVVIAPLTRARDERPAESECLGWPQPPAGQRLRRSGRQSEELRSMSALGERHVSSALTTNQPRTAGCLCLHGQTQR